VAGDDTIQVFCSSSSHQDASVSHNAQVDQTLATADITHQSSNLESTYEQFRRENTESGKPTSGDITIQVLHSSSPNPDSAVCHERQADDIAENPDSVPESPHLEAGDPQSDMEKRALSNGDQEDISQRIKDTDLASIVE